MPEAEASPVLTTELPERPAVPVKMAPRDPRLGQRLGKYRIQRRLGQGGMGVVYEAEDTLLKRRVALKFLPYHVSADPNTWQRFLLEAQAAARLNHPNAVAIYEIDQRDGTSFLAMEYVDGGSTHDHLKVHGAFAWPAATQILADVCRGLAAAHQAGLIHRDIKPANIMRGRDGTVKLADFGLAKATDSSASSITGSHSAVGTPSFMSPEQCQCEPVDRRSDIYSLGATYYTLLSGRTPFGNGGPLEVMFAHCSKPAPDPREILAEIPEACAAVVQKAMAKAPAERYQSAEELLAALEAALALPEAATALPPRGKRPSTVVAIDTLTFAGEKKPPPAETVVLRGRQWRKVPLAAAGVLLGIAIGVVAFFQPDTQAENPATKTAAAPAPPAREPEPPPKEAPAPRPPPSKAQPPKELPPKPFIDHKPFPKKPPRDAVVRPQRRPRVLFVLPPVSYLHPEYGPARRVLDDLGAEVVVASTHIHSIKPDPYAAGVSVVPDLELDRVQAREFDAVVLGGGKNVAEWLGSSSAANSLRHLLTDMHRDRKIIATFGTATGLLTRVDILRGVEVTAPPFLHDKLRAAGAMVVSHPVAISGRIITVREPMAAASFAHTLARELGLRP